MRAFSSCPFCGSRQLTVMARTERLTHKSCKRCYKLWAEPNVQAVTEEEIAAVTPRPSPPGNRAA